MTDDKPIEEKPQWKVLPKPKGHRGWICGRCNAPVWGPYDTCGNCGWKGEERRDG